MNAEGWVVSVTFVVRNAETGGQARFVDTKAGDWSHEWSWWLTTKVPFDGAYEIWAEAMDDEGNVGLSPKIQVTLHVTN